ncbi:MAG: hypothetical protein AAF727_08905 [Pseudomonadota bacterium]
MKNDDDDGWKLGQYSTQGNFQNGKQAFFPSPGGRRASISSRECQLTIFWGLLMKTAFLLATAMSVGAATADAASLLSNGDFEAGNVDFSTDLTFSPSASTGAAQYDVDTNPDDWFSSFAEFGDNTSGSGNMMMINGSTIAGDLVWSETVSVETDTDYNF